MTMNNKTAEWILLLLIINILVNFSLASTLVPPKGSVSWTQAIY